MQLCTYLVAHDGAADRLEAHLRAIGVVSASIATASASATGRLRATSTTEATQCVYERGTLDGMNHFLLLCPLQAPSFAAHEYILAQLLARCGGSLAGVVRSDCTWVDDEDDAPASLQPILRRCAAAEKTSGKPLLQAALGDDAAIPWVIPDLQLTSVQQPSISVQRPSACATAATKSGAASAPPSAIWQETPMKSHAIRKSSSLAVLFRVAVKVCSHKRGRSRSPAGAVGANQRVFNATEQRERGPTRRQRQHEQHNPLVRLSRESRGRQIKELCDLLDIDNDLSITARSLLGSLAINVFGGAGAANSDRAWPLLVPMLPSLPAGRLMGSAAGTADKGGSSSSQRDAQEELDAHIDALEEQLSTLLGCDGLACALRLAECALRADEWAEAVRQAHLADAKKAEDVRWRRARL
ncbi:hypothetical protein K437DRAFT_110860 [Tilletiaria anomala UBC 951]|uniref:Uncharacterized protein n=1 Tax=Tilletiaria anomala (strain ATCC 24038 / CBS 436.72 / UBC 951) TaxID=1037660 RepID=A0A066VWL4_TILAU|nr:uncharacterized protein K437DRAFT_110860 [Tilletiaria anomala UBC 951]KDN46132.1 hypothetical protein K437DRAFT_110860 [Tilletiaria anomala UBC 951]